MKRAIGTLIVLLALSGGWARKTLAQAPQGEKAVPLSKVERLNRAPVNKEVLRVKLPRPRETKLANGLTVLVLEQHRLPTVAFSLWIKTGALTDPPDRPGVAEATAAMLREGTAHRTSAQMATEIDTIGASLGASADFGSSTSNVYASGLAASADRILDLMSDMVLNPTFPADEFAKYQKRELARLEQQRSQPFFLARERLYRDLYRDFPAAVVSATPDSMKALAPDKLKEFHDQYYLPNNAILGVAGDVQYDQILSLIEKSFGGWQNQPVNPPSPGELPPPAPTKIALVDRPGSVQTNILAGDYAVRRADPDYIPLTVMNRILGGGPSARLFLNLRENKGYTYGAYSSFNADVYPGAWTANTEVRNAVTDGSMHELMYEFKRVRSEKVPVAELDEARRSLVARFALSLEQPAGMLNSWMTVNYYGLPEDYWDRYPEEVAKVTPEIVQQAATKYVDLNHLQFVCVGDGKQIKEILKKYGPVEVYNTDGQRVE
jgi:predicted Zn-dependent peptidase